MGAVPGVDYPSPPPEWQGLDGSMTHAEREKAWKAFEGRPISRAEADALREVNISRGLTIRNLGRKGGGVTAVDGFARRNRSGGMGQAASDLSWSTSETASFFSSTNNSNTKVPITTTRLAHNHQSLREVREVLSKNGRFQGSADMMASPPGGEKYRDRPGGARSQIDREIQRESRSEQRSLISLEFRGGSGLNRGRRELSRDIRTGGNASARGLRCNQQENAYSQQAGRGRSHPHHVNVVSHRGHSSNEFNPALFETDWDASTSSQASTPRSDRSLEGVKDTGKPSGAQCIRSGGPSASATPSAHQVDTPPPGGGGLGIGASSFHLRGEADADDVLRAMVRLSKYDENRAATTVSGVGSKGQCSGSFLKGVQQRAGGSREPVQASPSSAGLSKGARASLGTGGGIASRKSLAIKSQSRRRSCEMHVGDGGPAEVAAGETLDIEGRTLQSAGRVAGGWRSRPSERRTRILEYDGVNTIRERGKHTASRHHREHRERGFFLKESHSAPGIGQRRLDERLSSSGHVSSVGVSVESSRSVLSTTTSRSGSHTVVSTDETDSQPIRGVSKQSETVAQSRGSSSCSDSNGTRGAMARGQQHHQHPRPVTTTAMEPSAHRATSTERDTDSLDGDVGGESGETPDRHNSRLQQQLQNSSSNRRSGSKNSISTGGETFNGSAATATSAEVIFSVATIEAEHLASDSDDKTTVDDMNVIIAGVAKSAASSVVSGVAAGGALPSASAARAREIQPPRSSPQEGSGVPMIGAKGVAHPAVPRTRASGVHPLTAASTGAEKTGKTCTKTKQNVVSPVGNGGEIPKRRGPTSERDPNPGSLDGKDSVVCDSVSLPAEFAEALREHFGEGQETGRLRRQPASENPSPTAGDDPSGPDSKPVSEEPLLPRGMLSSRTSTRDGSGGISPSNTDVDDVKPGSPSEDGRGQLHEGDTRAARCGGTKMSQTNSSGRKKGRNARSHADGMPSKEESQEGSPKSHDSGTSRSTTTSRGGAGSSRGSSKQGYQGVRHHDVQNNALRQKHNQPSARTTPMERGSDHHIAENLPRLPKREAGGKGRGAAQVRPSTSADRKVGIRASEAIATVGGELPDVGGGGVGPRSRGGAVIKRGGGGDGGGGGDIRQIKVHSRPTRVESLDLQTTTEALTAHHLTVDELLEVRFVGGRVMWRADAQ